MLKAIVVDDEARARRVLESFIAEYCPQVNVVASAEDVPGAVKAIKKFEPDLVFLDIEMPGYNGFQLLEFFDDINFEIVFVTAYSEFALKAFQVSAIDYLLKPLQIDQLIKAVEKVERISNSSLLKERIDTLKSNLADNSIKKIVVPVSDGSLFINVADITHLKSEGSYVNIYINDGNKVLVSKNIKDYEDILTIREGFIRTHRSYLVNKKYIVNIGNQNTEITLSTQQVAFISRDRKQEVLDFIKAK